MDLSTMRSLVRRDLHDEDPMSYRWTDNELDRHITRAVQEFSRACPREEKATVATTAGSRDVSVAGLTDMVSLVAVEYPVDRYPKSVQRFSVYHDTLTFLMSEAPDGSNCYIYYGKVHTLDAGSSTLPARFEELVATGAAAFAALEWALYTADRINATGDQAATAFLRWHEQRRSYFEAELRKIRSRLRPVELYGE